MRISENEVLNLRNVISTVTSEPYPIDHLVGFSVEIEYTPSSNIFTGKIILEAKNKLEWYEIVSTEVNHTDNCYLYNVRDAFYRNVRIKIEVYTGSLVNLMATINAKGF